MAGGEPRRRVSGLAALCPSGAMAAAEHANGECAEARRAAQDVCPLYRRAAASDRGPGDAAAGQGSRVSAVSILAEDPDPVRRGRTMTNVWASGKSVLGGSTGVRSGLRVVAAAVISSRQVDFGAISRIETPDPLTIVFHLQWPEAAMLANFASPWNCVYSAAKLAEDPNFPKTHILGTGPFAFVEHVKGQVWRGRRWEKYFQPGKPYLDGYQADFMPIPAVMKAYESGKIMAEFRGVTPKQRDELAEALGDKITTSESPWLSNLLVVFNTGKKPFDDARVRRALSMAIDRWGAAEKLQGTTFLK